MEERKEMEPSQRGLQLQDLPDLVFFHILDYLDVSSRIRAWKASALFRRALRRRVFLSRVNLSERRVPRETCDFLKNIAVHVEHLDLRCAKGLSEKDAVEALKLLVNLRSLDVTYTAVTLSGASDICNSCPHLVRLACNITYKTAEPFFGWPPLLNSFRNLESVNFVISSMIHFEALNVLVRANNLKEYKCIKEQVVSCSLISDNFAKAISEHPNLRLFNCHTSIDVLPENVNFIPREFYDRWEFVAVVYAPDTDSQLVFLSPGLQVESNLRYRSELFIEVIANQSIAWNWPVIVDLFAWRSDQVELGTNLYTELLREIESNLCRKVCTNLNLPYKCYSDLNKIKSFRICRSTYKKLNEESDSQYDLNLTASIPVDQKLMITLKSCCYIHRPCTNILSINIPFLRNIVHISLRDESFDSSLYDVLFRNCVILETLDVELEIKDLHRLTESLHLCRSVRNICIGVMKNYDNKFDILLSLLPALVMCPRIENLCIFGIMECSELDRIEEVVESFLVGCTNLCSLRFCGNFSTRLYYFLRGIIYETLKKLDMKDVYVSFTLPIFCSSDMNIEYPPSLVFFETRDEYRLGQLGIV